MRNLREATKKHLARQNEIAVREASRACGRDVSVIDWEAQPSLRRLRESVTQTAFPQLLRAGVQSLLFDAYEGVGVVYPDLVRVVNSDKAEELYAPLYPVEQLKEVLAGQKFEDSRLQGLDTSLRNRKFGRILGVERELVDDDQTGQVVQKAQEMGEMARIKEETVVMAAILAATYSTAIGNRPSSGAQLSQPGLEAASIALEQMISPIDPTNFILVQPDTLLVSSSDKFNAAKLIGSALQPSVPGAAGQTASTASSGGTGFTMTTNPLQGLFAIKDTRFLPTSASATKGLDNTNGAWFLLQSKKSIVFQDRDPLEVGQENPQSGEAFDRDAFRYKVRRRFAAGVIESRYIFRGN